MRIFDVCIRRYTIRVGSCATQQQASAWTVLPAALYSVLLQTKNSSANGMRDVMSYTD